MDGIYMIGVVSRMLGIHQQTIRQYEKLGLLRPERTEGNTRLYSEEDLERLRFILNLTRDMGINLAGVEIIINMREEIAKLEENVKTLNLRLNERFGENMEAAPFAGKQITNIKIEKG